MGGKRGIEWEKKGVEKVNTGSAKRSQHEYPKPAEIHNKGPDNQRGKKGQTQEDQKYGKKDPVS